MIKRTIFICSSRKWEGLEFVQKKKKYKNKSGGWYISHWEIQDRVDLMDPRMYFDSMDPKL